MTLRLGRCVHRTAALLPALAIALSALPARASGITTLVPSGRPLVLAAPAIGVKATVESLALNRASDDRAPYRWEDVAWYNRSARPGDTGRAVVYGHLDSTCCPAVFWSLHLLKRGDLIRVSYPGGRTLTFRTVWQGTYLNKREPIRWMFGRTHERGLVLVTCAGVFHRDGTGYDHKLIVYARLVLPNGTLG